MSVAPVPAGRRERNKQAKLDRITTAAAELFAEHGVSEVTTQQIAEKADVGAGTLFLYAKTKGELLLMVQNAHYAEALGRGEADAAALTDGSESILAIVRQIVECNRRQVENGRTYLREMVFGDPAEPRHGEALAIVAQTEAAIARILRRAFLVTEGEAAILAHVVSAIMFLCMAASVHASSSVDEIILDIRQQIAAVLPR
ncbi:TetR/AcrR family transcriptional regulator [Nocardia sp. NPDC127606]|uniref:TetR/AcrR family transcriptional regulator n=1 Tax=Nocardia sp. NPDC127606 TaxID=3345406 RepID=UPI00363FC65A